MFHDYSFQNYVPSSYLSLPCIMNKNLLRLFACGYGAREKRFLDCGTFFDINSIKAYCRVSQPGGHDSLGSRHGVLGGREDVRKKKQIDVRRGPYFFHWSSLLKVDNCCILWRRGPFFLFLAFTVKLANFSQPVTKGVASYFIARNCSIMGHEPQKVENRWPIGFNLG